MNYLGFPVTFGYLEKTTLKGGENYTHRGIDLGSFEGQELRILGTLIGLTGSTGKTEGPHTHVQVGRDPDAQQTIDPSPYIGKPGTVVKVGEAPQWGKFVCIKVADVYVYYCHLSRIDVKEGQAIGGGDKVITVHDDGFWREYVRKLFLLGQGKNISEQDFQHWVGKDAVNMVDQVLNNPLADQQIDWSKWGKTAKEDDWPGQIRAATETVVELQGKLAAGQSVTQEEIDALADRARGLEQAIRKVNN